MKFLALLFTLFFVTPAWGAYALVSNVSVGNTAPGGVVATSAGIDTTGADLLICVQTHYGSEGAYGGSPSDNKSNTWSEGTNNENNITIRIYYATNVGAKVGAGHTFTTGGYAASMQCMAFSGSHLTAPLDQQLATAYTPYADNLRDLPTGSITPSQNSELVIAGCGVYDLAASSGSINGGFTITNQVNALSDGHLGSFSAYLIQTTATAANPTCSWSNQNDAAAVIASFKVPVGAATRRPIGALVFP